MTSGSGTTTPGRLLLVPGVRVVERGRDRFQVGLERGRAVVLRRSPASELVLEALGAGRTPPAGPAVEEVLAVLAEHELLLDARALPAAGPATARDVCALALQSPTRLPDAFARRRSARVRVVGGLGPDPVPLLAAAGVDAGVDGSADVVLVATIGEPARELLDPLVRHNTSHLVVRIVDGVATIGPFVVPGVTACLRCLDAHRADDDPGHPAVIDRYVEATAAPRADGLPEPVDTALATLATAWAVRDIVSHLDGDRPSTWSSTLRLTASLGETSSVLWRRHPECGCVWPSGMASSGTLEA